MAWSITERFPAWGETGEFPVTGFFYDGGDQVNEKHLDALWNGINGFEEDVQSALNDIDSDADGVVDEADTTNLYKGNDIDADGNGVVDDSERYDGLAPSDGTAGQKLETDGNTVSWVDSAFTAISEDGTEVAPQPTDINFTNGITVTDDGDNTVTVDANENSIAYNHVMR